MALVALVGLPGAGKSTVCKKFKRYIENKCLVQPVHVIHVCYDDLIPLSAQEKFFQLKISASQNETYRTTKEPSNTKADLENLEQTNWKTARRDVYLKVEQLVDCLKSGSLETGVIDFFTLSNNVIKKETQHVILLDDNFYYRSMRYEYFQLARKYSIGFCELYVECSADVAVRQNLQRDGQVPSEVIEAMKVKLEPPLPDEHSWESTSCTLQTTAFPDFSCIWDMILQCLKTPVLPLVDRSSEIAEARMLCSSSVAHQADIYLRSIVGQVIKERRHGSNVTPRELSEFSRKVNDGRQAILAAVRDGSLYLPPSVRDVVSDDNREELLEILSRELRKKLS